jgi:hypothetical protein
MQLHMDREDATTIRAWQAFLTAARLAGAAEDAAVEEVTDQQDPSIVTGFRIDTGQDAAPAGPASVTVPADILADFLTVVRDVAISDGDVRGSEPTAQRGLARFSAYFLEPTLGPDLAGLLGDDDR